MDLMQALSRVIGEHRGDILNRLDSRALATLTTSALQNEQAMSTVATCCYELLPGLVRLAVKEHTVRAFVMNNRERILQQLLQAEEGKPAL